MENRSKNEITRLYWQQKLTVLWFNLMTVCLILASLFSLYQTEGAFRPMNDPSIVLLGFKIGNLISLIYAIIAQYSQNIALYIRGNVCTGKVVVNSHIPIVKWHVYLTDKDIAMLVFWLSAFIDALTNCVWFYRTVETPDDFVLAVMLGIIGYLFMVGMVFSEELLGIVLDSRKKAIRQMKSLEIMEEKSRKADEREAEKAKAEGAKSEPYIKAEPYKPEKPEHIKPERKDDKKNTYGKPANSSKPTYSRPYVEQEEDEI